MRRSESNEKQSRAALCGASLLADALYPGLLSAPGFESGVD
jgi:hypothetical protein